MKYIILFISLICSSVALAQQPESQKSLKVDTGQRNLKDGVPNGILEPGYKPSQTLPDTNMIYFATEVQPKWAEAKFGDTFDDWQKICGRKFKNPL